MAQWVCQWAISLLEIRCHRPWFETCVQQKKATCLLSIRKSFACARASELATTNMYVWFDITSLLSVHQTWHKQTRTSPEQGVKPYQQWVELPEYSLIIETGYCVQVFSFILNSSISLWVGIQSAWDWCHRLPFSNLAFSRGRLNVSIWFENRLPVSEYQN